MLVVKFWELSGGVSNRVIWMVSVSIVEERMELASRCLNWFSVNIVFLFFMHCIKEFRSLGD